VTWCHFESQTVSPKGALDFIAGAHGEAALRLETLSEASELEEVASPHAIAVENEAPPPHFIATRSHFWQPQLGSPKMPLLAEMPFGHDCCPMGHHVETMLVLSEPYAYVNGKVG